VPSIFDYIIELMRLADICDIIRMELQMVQYIKEGCIANPDPISIPKQNPITYPNNFKTVLLAYRAVIFTKLLLQYRWAMKPSMDDSKLIS
jgi:hypothetical protein